MGKEIVVADLVLSNISSTPSPDLESEAKSLLSEFETAVLTTVFHMILEIPLNTVGTITNVFNIVVLYHMGFSETVNIGLMGLAISDLFSLLTLQWLNICSNPWVHFAPGIPFESFEVQYITGGWTHNGFARITGMISFERCLCVTVPLKVKAIITPSITLCIIVAIFLINLAGIAPVFAVNGLGWKFFESHNRSLIGLVFREDKREVESVLMALNSMYSFAAFGVVIVCTAVLAKTLNTKSKWRKEVTGAGSGQSSNSSDLKERRVVVMVTAVSVVFIVCFFPVTVIPLLMMAIPEFSIVGTFKNLIVVSFAVAYFLETINGTVNFFIYMKMSTKLRTTFNRLVHRKKEEVQ